MFPDLSGQKHRKFYAETNRLKKETSDGKTREQKRRENFLVNIDRATVYAKINERRNTGHEKNIEGGIGYGDRTFVR